MGHHRIFFTAFNITFIPRDLNQLVDSLIHISKRVISPVWSKSLIRPYVPDNIKHWQVFKDDREIKRFQERVGEFAYVQNDDEQGIVDLA